MNKMGPMCCKGTPGQTSQDSIKHQKKTFKASSRSQCNQNLQHTLHHRVLYLFGVLVDLLLPGGSRKSGHSKNASSRQMIYILECPEMRKRKATNFTEHHKCSTYLTMPLFESQILVHYSRAHCLLHEYLAVKPSCQNHIPTGPMQQLCIPTLYCIVLCSLLWHNPTQLDINILSRGLHS